MAKFPRLILALLISLVGGSLFAQAPLEKVRLQLKWTHQFQFAGYYAAIQQGYYREAGLDVELLEAQPGRDPTQEVLAGRAQYGVGNSDLLLYRHRGEPVVVLAAIFQHSPMVLLVRAASGITDLQGLHDRELMMLSSESAELFAYFKFEGIDPAKLRIRAHSLNIDDFISGRVDGMSAYGTDEPFNLRQRGVPFLQFTPRAGGIDFYGDNLFTTERELAEHPARVRAFRAASLRGWEYALQHPDEIVDLILRDYPRQVTREHLKFEAAQTSALMHPGLIEVGHMNPGRWRHMAETYAEFDMLPREMDLTGFLYDPNPKPDLRWLYWTLGVALVLLVAALGWVLPLVRLNRQLRRAKEEAEAADAAKTRFLAFLAHEIRTPLNGLVGVIDLLKHEPSPAEQRAGVDLLSHSAENLLQLVDNVLNHSRIASGQMELERVPVVLGDFLADITALFSPSARARGVVVRLELAPGLPGVVHTDPIRLRQILSNLMSNAVKFTKEGEIVLRAEAEGKSHLVFSVRDTGVGIPAELMKRIFEPYRQADASVARNFGGAGLGLSISRSLARLLGGELAVSSEAGRGSTFTVRIEVGGETV
jgi:signal transduction histidine kinase/ABC-type nitrate/sulfonate/bicarbonate transport system substrate-binding protein